MRQLLYFLFLFICTDRFSMASSWPTMVGLKDVALFDQEGKMATTPNFPFRIDGIFKTDADNGCVDLFRGCLLLLRRWLDVIANIGRCVWRGRCFLTSDRRR